MVSSSPILPPEWAPQRFVQLTWPHAGTDWAYMLNDVCACFADIAREIARHEDVLVVCASEDEVRRQLAGTDTSRIRFVELPSNDTWARDHGGITVLRGGRREVLDFTFNGWGMKFAADKDNLITRRLFEQGIFPPDTRRIPRPDFVLEGGSIESDGAGTLLTTARCLLSDNRNDRTKEEVEAVLRTDFGLQQVLWLHHGYLAGDDTDSHVDTLARFCPADTITYVQCTDPQDEHYAELRLMEEELRSFRTPAGKPYRLVPLPMADAVYEEGMRLPATYANFLIINGAVLMPTYGSPRDETARAQLQTAFPGREVVGIDCRPLIRQHGSLHCVTMQYP